MLTKRTRLLIHEIADQSRGHGKNLMHENISVYRRLIYKIFEANLSKAFPLTSSYLNSTWKTYIDLFVKRAEIQIHQVCDLGLEFYHWLHADDNIIEVPQLVKELMHFEIGECQVFNMKNSNPLKLSKEGSLQNDCLLINQESMLSVYSLPVFKLKAQDIIPDDKGAYFLFMYRDPKTKYVRMIECSKLAAFIIETLKKDACKLSDILTVYSQVTGVNIDKKMQKESAQLVKEFIELKAILGFHPTNKEN